ncbi:hypothetical protein EDD11_001452 [Mortierella claussenii]|nr:hypothetical protein EDD11_001452 [Mortierella claussenii]
MARILRPSSPMMMVHISRSRTVLPTPVPSFSAAASGSTTSLRSVFSTVILPMVSVIPPMTPPEISSAVPSVITSTVTSGTITVLHRLFGSGLIAARFPARAIIRQSLSF